MAKSSTPKSTRPSPEIVLHVRCGVCGKEVLDSELLCETCREIPAYRDELNRRLARVYALLINLAREGDGEGQEQAET